MKKLIIFITVTIILPFATYSQEIVFQNEYDFKEDVNCIKVSNKSNFLAVGTSNRVDLIDLNSLKSIFESEVGKVISVDITVDEQRLLALTSDRKIYEWDINTKQLIREIDYFVTLDSITGVRKAIYYPVDNRICVDAYFEHWNVYKPYFYLYNNDNDVLLTGYGVSPELFDFTSDGKYFVDPGILSVITRAERLPSLAEDLQQSDVIETFKDYDVFDKPVANHLDISSNNKYALVTSDQGDISVIDLVTKTLFTSKLIKQKYKLNIGVSSINNSGNYLLASSNFEQYLSVVNLNINKKIYEAKNILISGILEYNEHKKFLIVNHFYNLYIYSFDLDVITGVEDKNSQSGFNLYPSPSNDQINLKFNSNVSGTFTAKLVDIAGNTLLIYPKDFVQIGLNTFNYNTASYPPGEYFLVTEGIINESFPFIIGE